MSPTTTKEGGGVRYGSTEIKGLLEENQNEAQNDDEQYYVYIPRRTNCHVVFILVSTATVIASTCLAISQAIPVLSVGILHNILRIYIFIFCFIFILTELELKWFEEKIPSLQNWMLRGWIYSFVGIIGAEEATSVQVQGLMSEKFQSVAAGHVVSIFLRVSSWAMAICGALYFLMGLICMKGVRDKHREQYESRFEESKLPDKNIV
uniref:Uncharacterized protein n=1 Tax=Ditylum brightwellii TaxID=49249 RepID=A0A7S1ZES8_9STRA|mmetsp:Transcript_30468/g.45355  ORF Transcript_30468/g.45355 Transcript_30468/m.45355 type:complete len:207 (+) Transcript_30468:71-691(+)